MDNARGSGEFLEESGLVSGATLSHSWSKGGMEGGRAASRRLARQAGSRTARYRPMTGLIGVRALTVMFPATPRRARVHELGTRERGTAGNSRAGGLGGWSPLSFACCLVETQPMASMPREPFSVWTSPFSSWL